MSDHRTVTFIRVASPYQPGDVAGFPAARAQYFVDRRLADFFPGGEREPAVDFDAMGRVELVQHAKTILCLDDEPPAEVTDDELRAGLKAHAKGMQVPAPADEVASLDQLDAMDRSHLEAFAHSKAGIVDIDPALSDDDLRAQIRAVAESATSFVGTPSAAKKAGKGK